MTEREQDLFYIGAALFLNLDSAEVDIILATVKLTVEASSVTECRKVIRAHFPGRYELVRKIMPF
jgi:hypothetical protein